MSGDLRALPKAHLHLHLEGAMRPGTLRERAERYGVEVPPVRGFGSFTAFAGMYVAACQVLLTDDDLRRVVTEVVEDAAADGAVWVEPAFYPPHHNARLGPDERLVELVLEAGQAAAEEFGIGFGLVVAADRTAPPEQAVALARLAARYAGQGVVGFGLANDEALVGPLPFAPAYRVAKEAGLLAVPHGGELAGPENVRGALDALGADRVQHGVRAVEDPALVDRLVEEQVCLDVCPTSNVLLSVVPSIEEHPLRQLLDAGVRCSVNADDPLLFGPGLLEEYELCRTSLGLSDGQLATVARSSLLASGAPRELVTASVAAVDAWQAACA